MFKVLCIALCVFALGCESKSTTTVEAPDAGPETPLDPASQVTKANKDLKVLKKDLKNTMDTREGDVQKKVDNPR